MTRWLVVATMFAAAACATVAGIDVNRSPAAGADDAGDRDPDGGAPVADAAIDVVEEDAAPSPGTCTCLVLGCARAGNDGRDCCWNPEGGLAKTSYGTCASGRAACAADDDCKIFGGTCQHLGCGGSDIGVCGNSAPSSPACP